MILSKYFKIYPHREDPDSLVLFSTKKTSIINVHKSLIEDIEHDNLSEGEKQALTELGFMVDSHEAEKKELLGFMDDLNEINNIFKSYVVMNLDCNLACKYCFEGQRKGKHFMTRETADAFAEFVEKRVSANNSLNEINIVYYGGEPLLSTDLILYISGRLKTFADSRQMKYKASLITNGTLLTRSNVERLKPAGLVDASVTLDGPKSVHDQFRPFKAGKGSFDAIVRNLKDVCDMLEIQVGGNYTEDHYREFPTLLDYLLAEGLGPDKIPDVRFDFVTTESSEFAPPDFHDGCASANEPWLFEAGLFLRDEILKRGFSKARLVPWQCMLEYQDRMVVNYNGDIYKCPGLIGREELKVGNISTGVSDHSQSHSLDNWKNEKCLECEYLPLCFGGCRYMKLVRDGHMNGVDCKKPYLDAVLEQLVMQDIKYGGTE